MLNKEDKDYVSNLPKSHLIEFKRNLNKSLILNKYNRNIVDRLTDFIKEIDNTLKWS